MTSPLVIGVDSSTTSTKAIVVDAQGTVLAQGKADFPMNTPRVDFYEQDPRDWWRSTDDAVAQAIGALDAPDRGRISHPAPPFSGRVSPWWTPRGNRYVQASCGWTDPPPSRCAGSGPRRSTD